MKKNILLIGGSYGIGNAIAEQLNNDYNVFIASRTKERIENANHILFNALTDELDVTTLPNELHGFVYCPGSINLKPLKMLGADAFEKDMHINFFSLIKAFKTIESRLADNSSVVFFSTVAVQTGMPFHTSVAASKGAIEGFAKSLAAEYAPKIRVNVIAPSLIDTPLAKRLLNNDKKREAMAERHPLKRVGNVLDIANVAVLLLSDKSSWITGQVLKVDGGISTLKI